jgi:hypothetical protein
LCNIDRVVVAVELIAQRSTRAKPLAELIRTAQTANRG